LIRDIRFRIKESCLPVCSSNF